MLVVDGIMQDYTEAVENKIVNIEKQHSQTNNSMEKQNGGRTNKTKDFDGSSVVMDMDRSSYLPNQLQATRPIWDASLCLSFH